MLTEVAQARAGLKAIRWEVPQPVADDLSARVELAFAAYELLIRRFANHRCGCHCFVCRNLTGEERRMIEELRS